MDLRFFLLFEGEAAAAKAVEKSSLADGQQRQQRLCRLVELQHERATKTNACFVGILPASGLGFGISC